MRKLTRKYRDDVYWIEETLHLSEQDMFRALDLVRKIEPDGEEEVWEIYRDVASDTDVLKVPLSRKRR